MVIQMTDYCDRRAEKTFEILIKAADSMMANHRTKLVQTLKQCKRVARYQRKKVKSV